MEVKLLNKKDNKISFIIEGITPAYANTLRRIMMMEVPVLAIEEVNFLKNSSALYDEIIAHRLGLIPLKTDLKSYNIKEDCKCKGKGCALCQLNLNLKVKGPVMVYASDLKSQDPGVEPVYGNMPIVNLIKGQQLELEAVAVLGKGKDHVKFSPGLVFYKNYPEIIPKKDIKEKIEVSKDKVTINDKEFDILDAQLEAYEGVLFDIKRVDDRFVFYVESWGQLKAEEIILKSFDILDEKLDEFSKQLKKIK